MSTAPPPNMRSIDHVHVFVADRVAAERWYRDVLGLTRIKRYEHWAEDGGPLTVQNEAGTVHLALFERPYQECRSTIALEVDATGFVGWKAHLTHIFGQEPALEDHGLSYSLYFRDPDGNPYEITTYEYEAVKWAPASGGLYP